MDISSNSITVENNNIGYLVYVSNPYFYQEGIEYKVYLYQQIKEDENSGVKWINIDDVSKVISEPKMLPIYSKLNKKIENLNG